ncbi:MAG TPA: alpha/beta fold hydrolase [Acidimicrobiales bacterium]|jgi:putative redox protein
MDLRIPTTDGVSLAAHLALPPAQAPYPALVLSHGFPLGKQTARSSGLTYPELADVLAERAGWAVVTFNFRGTGESSGDFSLAGWRDDLVAVHRWLIARDDVSGGWLLGASAGGALSICAAIEQEVRGVATLGAPAGFEHWGTNAGLFLDHAREIGIISRAGFPADPAAWAAELTEISPLEAASKLAPTPLFIAHGDDDDIVPLDDARALAESYGPGAELHIVRGGGHRLRHDPRGVALVLGWLDRQAPGRSPNNHEDAS